MSTNSKTNPQTPTTQQIREAFSGLFTARTDGQHRADEAQLLSFRFLSEIERIMDERQLTRRSLAEAVGTSPSYITQLFRGSRLLNIDMLARFEQALFIRFTATGSEPVAVVTPAPKHRSRSPRHTTTLPIDRKAA
jgi:ribosome-binding protein aMBF1 (putative translation factor)